MERRSTAIKRFAKIARVLASTQRRLLACDGDSEPTSSSCPRLGWQGSPRDLALSTLTVVLHESGLREDIQFGRPPFGRGPAGEACMMQIALEQAPRWAVWLPEEQRQRIANSPRRREKFAQTLLGDEPKAMARCFEIGMRMLASSRRSCSRSPLGWAYGMFSMYGGGKTCRVPPIGRTRGKTFQTLRAARPKLRAEFKQLLDKKS